jgi:hypothetical protein
MQLQSPDRVTQHKQYNEEHIVKECPPEFLLKPKPFVTNTDSIISNHIPKQAELNQVLNIIKRTIIRDYNLPFEANQFSLAQQSSPFFKPIFDYLAHNILPTDKKAARSIVLRSEQYLLCDNILFRLFFQANGDDHFCFQLAVPEIFIDPLISHFHDTVISNHQGCVHTYITLRK